MNHPVTVTLPADHWIAVAEILRADAAARHLATVGLQAIGAANSHQAKRQAEDLRIPLQAIQAIDNASGGHRTDGTTSRWDATPRPFEHSPTQAAQQAQHELNLARQTVANLERRLALLTAALPVTHDLTHPGQPVQLVADQQTQDEADSTEQHRTQPHTSPQPEQPDHQQDQQHTTPPTQNH